MTIENRESAETLLAQVRTAVPSGLSDAATGSATVAASGSATGTTTGTTTGTATAPVLDGPSLTVLPPELSQAHYEAMKAVADNLKPSEKQTKLKEQRQKEVRKQDNEKALREKEDLKKEIEASRIDIQNRA